MRYIRICLMAVVAVMLCSAFTWKEKDKKKADKPVYVYGLGASFKDSVVYITEVQQVDSVVLDRNGFLPRRQNYAYQLKNYLQYELGKPDYTCAIYFSENKTKLEKDASKLRKQYVKADTFVVEDLKVADFAFKKPQEY